MNLGDFNISVRKIVNGYIVSYPLPKKTKKNKTEQYEEREANQMFGLFVIGAGGSQPGERAEFYVPTKTVLEEVLPRLVMECYHGTVTLKDEV